MLIAADLVLASAADWRLLLVGVALWGVHMGMTQGLLAAMVADTAPDDLRGTAYGFFNLLSGVAMLASSVDRRPVVGPPGVGVHLLRRGGLRGADAGRPARVPPSPLTSRPPARCAPAQRDCVAAFSV